MIRYIAPLFLVILAGGVYFVVIGPTYEKVKSTQVEASELNRVLQNSERVVERRDMLLDTFNSVPSSSRDELVKMIPDHVDNVRLILEVDGVASRQGVAIKDIQVQENAGSGDSVLGPDESLYGTIKLSMTVTGSYESFLNFIADLEHSLRIVDISDLSLLAAESGLNQYNITVRTYWLR